MDPDSWDRVAGLIVGAACAMGAWALAVFALHVFAWLPAAVGARSSPNQGPAPMARSG